jgi:hypothetical protein
MGPRGNGRMLPIRTAVLVVHGMGIQRPLDTVRGVIKAVWLSGRIEDAANKVWFHPERSGIDIDLAVITTNWVPGTIPNRSVDFHELYWSHLMSETRGIAVLLWLFELARKGPRLKPNMALVWGAAALFLVLMILSTALIVLKVIERLAEVHTQPDSILFAPVLMFAIFGIGSSLIFIWFRAWRLAAVAAAFGGGLLLFYFLAKDQAVIWATWFLPSLVALIATRLLMGGWGVFMFAVAYILSAGYEYLVHLRKSTTWAVAPLDLIPWTMDSSWCVVAASVILLTYLIVSVVFLQPYLGDAARYFRDAPSNVAVRREIRRQAVSTLENLHLSGRYDRIVVVAHSLGTAIAYDMLRAYFARVARYLPTSGDGLDAKIADAEAEIDKFNVACALSRKNKTPLPDATDMCDRGRLIIEQICRMVQAERAAAKAAMSPDAVPLAADEIIPTKHRAWLVSDFVTLGSPLTHAHYLMCDGQTVDELTKDFARRVDEREFPVCPPERVAGDGGDAPLTYLRTGDPHGPRLFHNGALFGLTRWSNLYFPVSELFNGDAIGGPVAEVFGNGVHDVELQAGSPRGSGFDAHIRYWYVPDQGLLPEHIRMLRAAIDLSEAGFRKRMSGAA